MFDSFLSILSTAVPSAMKPEEEAEWQLARKLEWFQDLKFGFFTHWGTYSQWGCIESWPLVEEDAWARPDDLEPWVKRDQDMERFKRDYWALNRSFNPTHFDPVSWVAAAKQAGMRYFVFTTKHHDGFSMFDTRLTDYRLTSSDCPYSLSGKPDVARELFHAFREAGFGVGVYFSKADWHSPYYWAPCAPARTRNPNYDTSAEPEKWAKFVAFVHGQIEELMSRYGPVDILWLDAGQVRPPAQDIQMDRLARMARSHQPNLIIVDRTVGGKHENYRTPEQQVPDEPPDYVWETCMTMGDQWSYKPDDNYKSTHQLIHLLVDVVSKGGNLLLNVGPQPDGQLPPTALERMAEIGDWMTVNSEAIYGTRAVAPYKEGPVALTQKDDCVYAIYLADADALALPSSITLTSVEPQPDSEVHLLGTESPLSWARTDEALTIEIPEAARQSPPCKHAFVLRMKVR